MRLLDFVNDIFDIAAANDVSWDVGLDMFLANIQNVVTYPEAPRYAGAETLDYEALSTIYGELYTEEQLKEFNDQVRKFYPEICELRKDGKRDSVDLLFAEKDTPQ